MDKEQADISHKLMAALVLVNNQSDEGEEERKTYGGRTHKKV